MFYVRVVAKTICTSYAKYSLYLLIDFAFQHCSFYLNASDCVCYLLQH